MRRRSFLAGGLALGSLPLVGRRAHAGSLWGEAPSGWADLIPGEGSRAERMLEIFCYGGCSFYDTFYVVEEFGEEEGTGWHLHSDDHVRVFGSLCDMDEKNWLTPFATDANGHQVHLGPALQPLVQRPDILARTRIIVTAHDQLPHQTAVPLMITGKSLGNPRAAGFGAHVSRFWRDRSDSVLPMAYVLAPSTASNMYPSRAVGAHPASARPLGVTVTSNSDLVERLQRLPLGDRRETLDALVSHYMSELQGRYTHSEAGLLRSTALDDHDFALQALQSGPELAELLGPNFLRSMDLRVCGTYQHDYPTGNGIRSAIELLLNPGLDTRHCMVADMGFGDAGSYDSHGGDHTQDQTLNLYAALATLAALVNEPGEGDDGKLDLDDTMVVISTEFGRTITEEYDTRPGSTGHHPDGFVTVVIGGAITEAEAGLYGAIDADGVATDYISPSELRAGLLVGMGINPFMDEAFGVADVENATSEEGATEWLLEHVLGRTA